MKLEFKIAEEFGTRLADGARAAAFRQSRIDPFAANADEVVLDFSGVRSANSSFVNALITGFVDLCGERSLKVLRFRGCIPLVQVLVEGAIELGLGSHRQPA